MLVTFSVDFEHITEAPSILSPFTASLCFNHQHHGGFCKWMFLGHYYHYSDPVLSVPSVSEYMAKRGTLSPACQEPP